MSNISRINYEELVSRIALVACEAIPEGSTVLVVSKGDDELLKIRGRAGLHFPQNEQGGYTGHHPLDSGAAIAQLEAARVKGGEYLLIPASSLWWLDYYKQFSAFLKENFELIWSDESCLIYRLAAERAAGQAVWWNLVKNLKQGLRLKLKGGKKQANFATENLTSRKFIADPVGHLRFALDYPETLPLSTIDTPFDPEKMELNWVIPDFAPGMGGPAAIFRMIGLLEQFGHANTIWIRGGTRYGSGEKAREAICEHFTPIEARVRILGNNTDEISGDAVIATHCWTAYPVRAVTKVRERFYLIQDFEPWFNPMGADYLLAEATYRFGFSCITSSKWLQDLMRSRYGAKAERFVYAYDPAVYFEDPKVARAENRIAFYSRSTTPRRAVQLGLLALEILSKRGKQFTVDFFGGNVGQVSVPYEYVDHGVLNETQLAWLYRGATVGVVLSSTNYSLIPHEMMACGLPVVDLYADGTASEFPLDAIALSEPTPQAIADSIERLLTDRALRERQTARAKSYISQLSWEAGARQIERALIKGISVRSGGAAAGVAPKANEKKAAMLNVSGSKESPLIAGKRASGNDMSFCGPVVFAGQPEYYRSVYFDLTSSGGNHFEYPYTSADPSVLRELPGFALERGAKTCVVFRPEWLARYPEVFWDLKAQGISVIGYSTEPVPQNWADAHSDQLRRLEEFRASARLPFDLLIHYDESSLDFLSGLGLASLIAHPLPVSRKLFFPEDVGRDFDVCFLGKSTRHREAMLAPLKMRFNTVHVAHGLRDEDARILMNRSKLVLNLHNEAYPNFENRVVQALFCGRPVLSERLSGDLLIADRDYVLVDSPQDLLEKVREILENAAPLPTPAADLSVFKIEKLLERLGIKNVSRAFVT